MAIHVQRREFIAAVGAAAAWPLLAGAQQRSRPVIGYLSTGTEGGERFARAAFHQGLGQLGYIEGRNVDVLYRWAETRNDRLAALAADLVLRRVEVIATIFSTAATLAAKSATASTPIVFATGADPVQLGLVASLNRPGANITGVSVLTEELAAKRLQLLHEIVPAVTSVGLLVNPRNPTNEAQMSEAKKAAPILGVQLVVVNASTPNEVESAFAMLIGQHTSALLVQADTFFVEQSNLLTTLAARHTLPTIYTQREFVDAGGLMSYGASIPDACRLAGTYAGRILKGDKPSELPVQQSTRIEMVLNLKTAKALGIEVPTATLLRADEVIE